MKTSAPTVSAPPAVSKHQAESIRRLPGPAREAFERFQAGGDPAGLDPVLFAILGDFVPLTFARPLSDLPGSARLIDDLGFDSLAITELVFFTEDLFGITITNEEIIQVRTLDDLRGFIRGKVGVHAAP